MLTISNHLSRTNQTNHTNTNQVSVIMEHQTTQQHG